MKCALWMSSARMIQKRTEAKQTLRSPMKASKQSVFVRAGLFSVSEYGKWSTSPSMITFCIDRMVKRISLANVDKNMMVDERIPILDLIKVVEMLLPRRRSANSLKGLSDHFI
ncbi:hypothetical protein HDF11_005185 [Tunturiibacter psychrotolerans]